MVYAITGNQKRLADKKIDENLRFYHAQNFPLIDKNKIYRKVSSSLILVRASDSWSPADMLGFITYDLSLTDKDIMHCISVSEAEMERISVKTKDKLGYINDNSLQEFDSLDEQNINFEWTITGDVYFLAHYLFMIENDVKEKSRKPMLPGWILTDRFSQWKTKDSHKVEKWIGAGQKKKVIRSEQIVFSRFEYSDTTPESRKFIKGINLSKVAELLGFKIMFKVNDEIINTVDEKIFNSLECLVEVLFIGDKNWKDKLFFDLDMNFYNKMIRKTTGGRELRRKPPEWSILN